jgi:hypothetical protein
MKDQSFLSKSKSILRIFTCFLKYFCCNLGESLLSLSLSTLSTEYTLAPSVGIGHIVCDVGLGEADGLGESNGRRERRGNERNDNAVTSDKRR